MTPPDRGLDFAPGVDSATGAANAMLAWPGAYPTSSRAIARSAAAARTTSGEDRMANPVVARGERPLYVTTEIGAG